MAQNVTKGLLCLLLVLSFKADAQQDAQFSQYIFNGIYINPAYAGYREELNAHAFYRSQWVGIPGAPQTMSLAIDGSVHDNRMGLALQVVHDKIGAQSNLSAYGNYAYRIKLSEEREEYLALGIGAGLVQLGLDASKLDPGNINDPYLTGNRQQSLLFDARAGAYYTTENFFAGFSVDHLAAQFMSKKQSPSLAAIVPRPHFYLTAGGLVPLSESIVWKPTFLIKDDKGGPTSLDLNSFLLFQETVWVGASYRTAVRLYDKPNLQEGLTRRSAVVGMVEVYATPQLRIGYSYDYTLNRFQSYNNATHEISIGYYMNRQRTGKKVDQMRCFYF
ncbi:PorP/SprF family type IX secretion system membrane protein [Filimonas effusa]|uniref:Type IX secretion system membrane protein PorP/SprF n=1 Tax=Filimonas effusa TaxID=2508721 RepID=A0A4Q1D508_9BACT|nr:type IX secretion system membrane protein PorP/SprF [Filimonas effusa]RXK83555.1 type IX secretion system membrane protein PorP/SprF [Filimonas effusa]